MVPLSAGEFLLGVESSIYRLPSHYDATFPQVLHAQPG